MRCLYSTASRPSFLPRREMAPNRCFSPCFYHGNTFFAWYSTKTAFACFLKHYSHVWRCIGGRIGTPHQSIDLWRLIKITISMYVLQAVEVLLVMMKRRHLSAVPPMHGNTLSTESRSEASSYPRMPSSLNDAVSRCALSGFWKVNMEFIPSQTFWTTLKELV